MLAGDSSLNLCTFLCTYLCKCSKIQKYKHRNVKIPKIEVVADWGSNQLFIEICSALSTYSHLSIFEPNNCIRDASLLFERNNCSALSSSSYSFSALHWYIIKSNLTMKKNYLIRYLLVFKTSMQYHI